MWIILSLLTAFFLATSDALAKGLFERYDTWCIIFFRFFLSSLFLLPLFLFFPIPPIKKSFWPAVLLDLPLEIIAIIFYVKALEVSPISLSLPFLSFTPLFLILTSRVMIGEKISLFGVFGIVFIVFGSYMINLRGRFDLFSPIKAFFNEKGPKMILFVAFIYSITSNLGKVAIQSSSPQFFSIFLSVELAIFSVFPFIFGKRDLKMSYFRDKKVIAMSLFFASHMLFHMLAMDIAKVSYMISLKRTSAIFSVVYGRFLYKEEEIRKRLFAATLMVFGAFLISLSS